MAKVQHLL